MASGGKAVITSGFVIAGLGKGIEQLTSIRYRGRRFRTNRFRSGGVVSLKDSFSQKEMSFPLLEHRNNTTWTLAKGVVGEENYPLVLRDTYGKGQLITVTAPDEYGLIYNLPQEILEIIRSCFSTVVPYYLLGPGQASLFAYDNDTFAVYAYTGGLTKGAFGLAVQGEAEALRSLQPPYNVIYPSRTGRQIDYFNPAENRLYTVFDLPVQPGDLNFYTIVKGKSGEKKEAPKKELFSAPHDFITDVE